MLVIFKHYKIKLLFIKYRIILQIKGNQIIKKIALKSILFITI